MLTHDRFDFFMQHIELDSSTVRGYYANSRFQREEPDGSVKHLMFEVKADSQTCDAVVQTKKDLD